MTNRTNPAICSTIISQLGGIGRLSVMIGAKLFVDTGNGVQFKFAAKAKNKANCLVITLDADDTYTVTFHKIAKYDFTVVSETSMVYADQLRGVIEAATGLYLSL